MNQKLVSLSKLRLFWSGRNLIYLLADIFVIKPMLKELNCLEEKNNKQLNWNQLSKYTRRKKLDYPWYS